MYKEIGSEFSYSRLNYKDDCFYNSELNFENFVFSGRTAIETVLKNTSIHHALLPSYCCDSMIEPFRKEGIEVDFYSVNYDGNISIDLDIRDIDCIFWCNYFGYSIRMPNLEDFKKNGGVIIEDITHSFLSEVQYDSQSDYLVASLRKWGPVLCGGYVKAINHPLKDIPTNAPPKQFIEIKMRAMKLKEEYLKGNTSVCKTDFLNLFKKSNEWLSNNYSCLSIDDKSKKYLLHTDLETIRKIRKRNAQILYEGLRDKIKFLFSIEEMDCPLFVPIVIENGERDEIRKKLIDNKIYCPVHWPHPNAKCDSNLYDIELSLICDQRYDEEEMKRIVQVLKD